MLLLIDIGNSSVKFGVRKKLKGYASWHTPTDYVFTAGKIKKNLLSNLGILRIAPDKIKTVTICSVVPKATNKVKSCLKTVLTKAEVLVLGSDIKIPIKNRYKIKSQVGNDRLVNALALKQSYKLPALVVDFGTAITIDVVSKKGEYLGGVIAPGIDLSLEILHKRTAMLPVLKAQKPKSVVGRDSQESILSGIFYGYSFLVDGLIRALKKTTKSKQTVVATGGNLDIMKTLCKTIDHYDNYLTLKGIEIAFYNSKNKEKF